MVRLGGDRQVAAAGDQMRPHAQRLAVANHLYQIEVATEADDDPPHLELPDDALQAAVVAQHRHRCPAGDPPHIEEPDRLQAKFRMIRERGGELRAERTRADDQGPLGDAVVRSHRPDGGVGEQSSKEKRAEADEGEVKPHVDRNRRRCEQ